MAETHDRNLDVQGAARLVTRHRGVEQQALAKMLGVSQSQFSRLLAEARARRWLVEDFDENLFDEAELKRIEDRIYPGELANEVERVLRAHTRHEISVEIAYSGEDGQDNDTRLRHFGLSAGPYVRRLLEQTSGIRNALVAFGSAVRYVLCEGLHEAYRGRKRRPHDDPLVVLPCRGSALIENAANTSSVIAFEMAKAIFGDKARDHWISINDCPPVFPTASKKKMTPKSETKAFTENDRSALKKYLRLIPNSTRYYNFDESPRGLTVDVQAIFSSLGPRVPENDYTTRLFEIGCPELLDEKKWPETVLKGDFFGIPVVANRDKLTRQKRQVLEEFETKTLIGARRGDVERTIANGGIVVVMVALAENRVPCAIELCRQKLCTQLLIDPIVGRNILQRVKPS